MDLTTEPRPGPGGPALAAAPSGLDPGELELLHRALLGAARVLRRHHLFLWARGELHGLIPHDALLCLVGDGRGKVRHADSFTGSPYPAELFANLCDPERGMLWRLAVAWTEMGESPLLLSQESLGRVADAELARAADLAGFSSLAVHGAWDRVTAGFSLYVMARNDGTFAPRAALTLDLVTPHLHMAFMRLPGVETPELAAQPVERLITDREAEILQWIREGKSNHEIGMILGISPLTVKNHVQKILRKMNVHNRAQAVAKGMSLQILGRIPKASR